MRATRFGLSFLGLALILGCSTQVPSAQRTLLGITGYGVSLELLSASASAAKSDPPMEVNVGKYASQLKRGSVWSFGALPAPGLADFSLGALTSTTIPVNRIAGFPGEADRWGILVVNAATGAVAFTNIAAGTPITATGLTSGQTYRVQIAWFISGSLARVSAWSPAQTATLP